MSETANPKQTTTAAPCQHLHTETEEVGRITFHAGDISDTTHEVKTCLDCGKVLAGWYIDGFVPEPGDDDFEFFSEPF